MERDVEKARRSFVPSPASSARIRNSALFFEIEKTCSVIGKAYQ